MNVFDMPDIFTREVLAPEPRATLDQSVWWRDRGGVFHLIADMDADWRRFCARMLIDRAAAIHLALRLRAIEGSYWSYMDHAADKDFMDGWHEIEPPTRSQMLADIRKDQAHGDHLRLVRQSPQFRALIAGLDWLHPGVLI